MSTLASIVGILLIAIGCYVIIMADLMIFFGLFLLSIGVLFILLTMGWEVEIVKEGDGDSHPPGGES